MKATLLALALSGALAAGASQIVPATPIPFEPVNLRMTVDGCAFVPTTVRVRADGNTLKVTQHMNNCLVPGPVEIADVRLGSLAAGSYRVEVFASQDSSGTPAETLVFQVVPRPEAAVFPPPARPITDYSGLWGNTQESGWGLSLHQSATDVMFGALFVYDDTTAPEWFTFQGGRWESATRWTAMVYRTTGPFYLAPTFDPRLVLIQSAGAATIDFQQAAGQEGRARLSYTVDGRQVEKVITRTPM